MKKHNTVTARDFAAVCSGLTDQEYVLNPEVINGIRMDDPERAQAHVNVLGRSLTAAHHLAVDLQNVPECSGGGIQRLPFPSMLIGVRFESPDDPNLSSKGMYFIEEDEENDCGLILPFTHDDTGWSPSSIGIGYILDDDEPRLQLGTFQGFTIVDRVALHQEYGMLCEAIYEVIRDIMRLVHSHNVGLESNTPSRLKMMRARKKGLALETYHTIKLPRRKQVARESQGGTHASPAMHYRAAHYRTIHGGTAKQRDVFVHDCVVGAREDGKVTTDYEV